MNKGKRPKNPKEPEGTDGCGKERFEGSSIDDHREYLAEVSPEVVEDRLAVYRLKPAVMMEALPLICLEGLIQPVRQFAQWVHPLDPVSLDDLKNWVGVPNRVAKRHLDRPSLLSSCERTSPLIKCVPMHELPMRSFKFEQLEGPQRSAVQQMALNLLYGYVDEAEAQEEPVKAVINHMLERARNLRIFVCPNLIVCPGDKVSFQGFSTLLFNNILVYGTGQITAGNYTKVDAFQVRHVN